MASFFAIDIRSFPKDPVTQNTSWPLHYVGGLLCESFNFLQKRTQTNLQQLEFPSASPFLSSSSPTRYHGSQRLGIAYVTSGSNASCSNSSPFCGIRAAISYVACLHACKFPSKSPSPAIPCS